MSTLATVDGIDFGLLGESDVPEMVRLLGLAFTQRDPIALALGFTPADFQRFVSLLTAHAVEQGLTIIARAAGRGELAGVLLTEDSATPVPDGVSHLGSKYEPVFDLLGGLQSAYEAGRSPSAPGESAHLYLLGVAEEFGGRGIARQLVAQCTAHAARRGYRLAVAEATSRTSQHIFRKAGFVERFHGSYRDHLYAGKHFFASAADHGGPILMDRSLTPEAFPLG